MGAPCVFEVLVGREGSDVRLPTEMYVTYAYIDSTTAWWDVKFHLSQRYDSEHLWEYVKHVVQRACEKGITVLEFIVYADDGHEIWRGNF